MEKVLAIGVVIAMRVLFAPNSPPTPPELKKKNEKTPPSGQQNLVELEVGKR